MKRTWPGIPNLTKISWVDGVMAVFVFALLYFVIKLGTGMGVSFSPNDKPHIVLHWWMLPYYAGRSLLRMFIAYACSLVFTFLYGRIAATYKTAERILIPLLDILQSVPVLGFLSVTVTGFMALFPHSLLGVELASIFAIFTGQVWNMTFSFYHSVATVPRELREAGQVIQLDTYTKFTRLELPFSMIGLVWNSMMSFGGGWFFLAASESITVLKQNIQLPGIGSYMATAMTTGNIPALIESIFTMIVVIVIVDQLFWRPIVAWSQKFKMELSTSGDAPTSWFLRFLRRSKFAAFISAKLFGALFGRLDSAMVQHAKRRLAKRANRTPNRGLRYAATVVFGLFTLYIIIHFGYLAVLEVNKLGAYQVWHVIILGFYTLFRVMASTLIAVAWTVPVGVAIGLNPRASQIAQPFVQIAASFPANMFFPLIALVYINLHVNFQVGAVLLMMLGTQWYVLFSVIAGAMAIPGDLKEASRVLGLHGVERWKRLLLPSIFPYLITGCITASGGAWNASIIAELVSWRHQKLVASGLGSLITQATTNGNWPIIVLSIVVMAILVTLINRLLWRPLYAYADNKFRVELTGR